MPSIPDDLKEHFLKSCKTYIVAREQGRRKDAWLAAIDCRKQLQKIREISTEAQICQDMFQEFMTEEQAAETYQQIHNLTLSSPEV